MVGDGRQGNGRNEEIMNDRRPEGFSAGVGLSRVLLCCALAATERGGARVA